MDIQDLPLKNAPNQFDKLLAEYIPIGNQWYTPKELAQMLSIENPVMTWLKANQAWVIGGAAALFAVALLSRGRR